MILKSPTIYSPYQDIIEIFPRWSMKYQFYFANKNAPIEIFTFFNHLWEIPRMC